MATEMNPPINISETMVPEYDLQHLLHSLQQLLQVKITYTWIKGHQDEIKDTRQKCMDPFNDLYN